MATETQDEALKRVAASLTRAHRMAVEAATPFYAISPNVMASLEYYGLVDREAGDWTPFGRSLAAYFQDNGVEIAA